MKQNGRVARHSCERIVIGRLVLMSIFESHTEHGKLTTLYETSHSLISPIMPHDLAFFSFCPPKVSSPSFQNQNPGPLGTGNMQEAD